MDNWQSTFFEFETAAAGTDGLRDRGLLYVHAGRAADRRTSASSDTEVGFGPSDWLSAHEWAAARCGSQGPFEARLPFSDAQQ